jgi:two-component system, sensor histidine kinase
MSKIIIADDSLLSRDTMKYLMENMVSENEVETVNNGEMLVDRVRNGDYALIVTDFQMPNMDGIRATEEIRKFDTTTPICVITSSDVRDQALGAGATDFSPKLKMYDSLKNLVDKYNLGT